MQAGLVALSVSLTLGSNNRKEARYQGYENLDVAEDSWYSQQGEYQSCVT